MDTKNAMQLTLYMDMSRFCVGLWASNFKIKQYKYMGYWWGTVEWSRIIKDGFNE